MAFEMRNGMIRSPQAWAQQDAERERLRSAVVEACSAYCQSVLDYEEHGRPEGMTMDDWHYQHLQKQTAMIDAYKDLASHAVGQKDGR